MAVKITFAGVDKTAFLDEGGQNTFTRQQNERGPAQLQLLPGYVPTQYDRVIMYDNDGVTPVWDGFVLTAATQSLELGSKQHKTSAQLVDAMAFLDWCFWTADYTVATTLKTILTGVVAGPLNAYGITLDAAQDNGDTFQPFKVGDGVLGVKVFDFLRQLGTACSPPRVVVMSATRAIRMIVPGADTAPFSVTDATPNCIEFNWAHSTFTPANKVTLVCGPTGPGTPTQSWLVGTPSTWEVDIQCIPGGWNEGGVFENGVTFRTLSAPGGGGYYEFDPLVGKGTLSVGTGAKAANGTKLTFMYTAIYPFIVTATTGATPIIQAQYTDPDQLLLGPAQLEVNGLLAQLNQSPREGSLVTTTGGLSPGQSISITDTNRSVSTATFTIASVSAQLTEFRNTAGKLWVYTVQMTESTVYQGSFLEQMRQLLGGGSGSTPVTVAATGQGGSASDLVAHEGETNPFGGYNTSSLTVFLASGTSGPALLLGTGKYSGIQDTRSWAILAEHIHYSGLGTISALRFFTPSGGNWATSYAYLFQFSQDPSSPVETEYYLTPGLFADGLTKLFLGGNAGFGAGAKITGGYFIDLDVTNGITERSRTAKLGDRTTVAFSAGNFTANTGGGAGSITNDWTLGSGDQDTYAYAMVGRQMFVAFELKTTSVTNTPNYLVLDIPGAHTVDVQVRAPLGYFTDNNVAAEGMAVVVPGEAVIRIYRRDLAAFTNSTNQTEVRGAIMFWTAED